MYGGEITLAALWAVTATSGAIWVFSTDAFVEWVPLEWRGFPRNRALAPAKGTDPLRIALFAVRTELAACGTRIVEALNVQRWWSPTGDPLPAGKWEAHAGDLSDPALPTPLHQKIESAYQHCDRMNHRISRYIEEYRRSQVVPLIIPSSIFAFREGDEQALRDVLKRIETANTGISERVDA
jgi:hypothetical protein